MHVATVIDPPAPSVLALAMGSRDPLISVMIPVFNSAAYLRETLSSVLAQDLGGAEMEIVVLDNCSTDDDIEVVMREFSPDGRIGFQRHASNIGAIENFNECIRRARGQWVHLLHADDVVRPGFYAAARRAIVANPGIGAVACRVAFVDKSGLQFRLSDLEAKRAGLLGESFVERQLLEQRIQFVGMIVRRAVYEELGGFRPELRHCADWDMWNRVALYKAIYYEPAPLACYRVHPGADTAQRIRTGANVVDERCSIRLSTGYLAPPQTTYVYRHAMVKAAFRSFRRVVYQMWRGNFAIARRQLTECSRCLLATLTA